MKRKITALIISPWSNDWNMSTVTSYPEMAYFVRGLIKKGFTIHLLVPKTKKPIKKGIDALSVHTISIPYIPSLGKLWLFLQVLHYIIFNFCCIIYSIELFKRYSFDIIYGFSHLTGLSVYFLGRRFHKPTILKLIGLYFLYPLRRNVIHYMRYLFDIIAFKLPFTKLMVLDDGTEGDKVAKHFNIPEHKFMFYPQSVDKLVARKTCPQSFKTRLNFQGNEKIILVVARLDPLKGIEDIIKGFGILLEEKNINAKLVIIGDGPLRKTLEKIACSLRIQKNVRFEGSVNYQSVWNYYKIADLFVSANLYSNLTASVVEAMASGVPVIVTDVKETYKLVKHEVTGLLVTQRSPAILAGAIYTLLENTTLREKISFSGKGFVLKHFPSWDEKIEEESKLIHMLLKNAYHS